MIATYTIEAYYRADQPSQPAIITSPSELDRMVDDLLTQPAGHEVATLYVQERPWSPAGFPDHELCIGVDARNGHGVVIYSGAQGRGAPGSHVTHNPADRHDTRHRYHHFHTELVGPTGAEIPLADLRSATYEFLAHGGERPRCVQWQPYHHDTHTAR
jgi:hypothetical protein